MSGSIYGNLFQISTWGETHGKGVGVVVDGCPAGLSLSEKDIQVFLDRRKPGQSKYTTQRQEGDEVSILSGIFEGKTTGTPISLVVFNKDQRSKDYGSIAKQYRPGHADFTFDEKYGFRDYRGGGRSSGRETIARVAAGAIASKILNQMGIQISTYSKSIGPIEIDYNQFDTEEIGRNSFYMPDKEAAKKAGIFVEEMMKKQDSVGGIVECIVTGVPAGVGEPVFDKMDASLAKAVMSIGAVKGVEVGDGFLVSKAQGSVNNDNFWIRNGEVRKKTNHAGGILGGITDGDSIVLRAAFKPTPSIAQEQKTINANQEEVTMVIKGRHDPIIVPRAVVVVESMIAITILDLMMMNMTARLDSLVSFYQQ